MRIVQRAVLFLFSILLVSAGLLLLVFPFSDQLGAVAAKATQAADNWMIAILAGSALLALGVFTLLPFDLFRRKGRAISFGAEGGTVVIQLESFEASLRKTIAKLPMVKRAHVTVTPKEDNRKVGIDATVHLKKPAGISTRETAERLREFVDKAARSILGSDEITTVTVRVEDIQIDSTQTAESLNSIFADAEKAVVPMAVAAAAPVVTGVTSYAKPEQIEPEETEDFVQDVDDDAKYTPAHSEALVTYEEMQRMQQDAPNASVAEDDEDPLPAINAEEQSNPSPVTSFESLREENDGGDEEKPGEKA